jgi:hypothetical protein
MAGESAVYREAISRISESQIMTITAALEYVQPTMFDGRCNKALVWGMRVVTQSAVTGEVKCEWTETFGSREACEIGLRLFQASPIAIDGTYVSLPVVPHESDIAA